MAPESPASTSDQPQADVARVAVKSKPITTIGDARRVSKSFALKFLRKAFVGARIQRVETPAGTKIPPEVSDLGPLETWQVWARSTQGQEGVIEVTAPREMLPYGVVREAYRCRLQMDVTVEAVKGGVRLSAKPIPPPPEVEKAIKEQRDETIGYVNPVPAEVKP